MRPRWICCWPNPPMPARPGAASAHGCASTTAISRPGWPAIRCWRRADWDRSMPRPPTQMPRPATAWPWLARGPGGGHGIRAVPPTALQVDGRAAGLVTEALRGEGAVLRLPGGERFMPARPARGTGAARHRGARDLGRDVASRSALRAPGHLAPAARTAGPALSAVTALCAAHGIDIATQPMPVAPCALCLRRRPRGRGRRHRHRRPARRGRSRAHRPAWRQPAGQQFAAGMRGDGTGGGKRHRRIGRCSKRGALAASSPARAQLPARPATRPAPKCPARPTRYALHCDA